LPGRRVRTTAQRPWIDWAYARSDRFPPRGVTPLTPIMGRATDPGENHDPGKGQFTPSLTRAPRLENGLGHEDQLRPPSLNGGCRLGKATIAGIGGKEEDAPKAVKTPTR
jgi:hypothetical protein